MVLWYLPMYKTSEKLKLPPKSQVFPRLMSNIQYKNYTSVRGSQGKPPSFCLF